MQGIILAAGEGSRLKSLTPYKPALKLDDRYLLDYILEYFLSNHISPVYVHFNEEELQMDKTLFHYLSDSNVNHGFMSTPSSFHTFVHSMGQIESKKEEHVLVSMVDTILQKRDFENYVKFCSHLEKHESCLLVTSFIDDEKPLTVKVNEDGLVTSFQVPISDCDFITSGMYCFSSAVMDLLDKALQEGVFKMRNFLSFLVKQGHLIKTFHVKKSMDIDRPQDLDAAIHFLRGLE